MRKWFWKPIGYGLLFGLVLRVLGREGVVSLVFGWTLLVYLVWRAWPGVRADLGRVRGRLPVLRIGRVARLRRRGGTL